MEIEEEDKQSKSKKEAELAGKELFESIFESIF